MGYVYRWMEVERFEEVLTWAGAKIQWRNLEEILKSLHVKNSTPGRPHQLMFSRYRGLFPAGVSFIHHHKARTSRFIQISMVIQCRSILYIAVRGRIVPFRRRMGWMDQRMRHIVDPNI